MNREKQAMLNRLGMRQLPPRRVNQITNLQINYGVTADYCVVMIFNMPIENLRLTVEQADDLIEKLQVIKKQAIELAAAAAKPQEPKGGEDAKENTQPEG
jgi:adenosine deaminase